MNRTTSRLLIISMLIAPLSGCFGDDKKASPPDVVTPPPPPPPAAGFEDQFGAGFGKFFRAAAWSEPGDPQPGDVIPISLNSEPVDF